MGTTKRLSVIVGAAALVMTAGTANAQSATANGLITEGMFAGVDFGLQSFDGGFGSDTALYFGVNGGWRTQSASGLVYGVQANLGESTAKSTLAITLGGDTITTTVKGGLQYGFDGMVGKVFGQKQNMLAFATVGYGFSRVGVTSVSSLTGPLLNASTTNGGIRLGAGVEYAYSQKFNLRASVGYSDTVSDLQFLIGAVMPF